MDFELNHEQPDASSLRLSIEELHVLRGAFLHVAIQAATDGDPQYDPNPVFIKFAHKITEYPLDAPTTIKSINHKYLGVIVDTLVTYHAVSAPVGYAFLLNTMIFQCQTALDEQKEAEIDLQVSGLMQGWDPKPGDFA